MNSAREEPFSENSNPEKIEEKTPMEQETLLQRVVRYSKSLTYFVQLLLGLMTDNRVDRKVKIFAGSVLAYVFAPVDFIPELFTGLFGMLDDFVLSAFALNVIINWVDPEIVRSHWRGEEDLLETIKKGIKNAELLVPDAILKKIQVWIGKHAERALVPVEAAPAVVSEEPKRRKTTRRKK
jgi:uncharacterized membrane protein YkvA (DUF1232 family)